MKDAETFLSAVDSEILTVNFDAESEKSVVIVGVKDAEKLKKSIAEINFKTLAEKNLNAEIWRTEDKLTAVAFVENRLILGECGKRFEMFASAATRAKFYQKPSIQIFLGKQSGCRNSRKRD